MAKKRIMPKKHNLKGLGRRGLSLFLAMLMTISLIQISVFAVNEDSEQQDDRALWGDNIEITVKDSESEKEISDAQVSLELGDYHATKSTKRNGTVYFPNVKTGTYSITASKEGYETAYDEVTVEKSFLYDVTKKTVYLSRKAPEVPDSVTFNVYRLYKNEVPANINQSFDAKLFGPAGNDTPYFTVTVDMKKLLAMDNMGVEWKGNYWYVSLDTCALGATNADKLDPFWENILACMDKNDAEQFENFFAGNFRGYVLKQENGKPHIDGIVTAVPPAYTTELYVNGDIIKNDTISHEGRLYSFVTDGYEKYLEDTYGSGEMNWTDLKYTTDDGSVYQLTLGEWPEENGKIEYTPLGSKDFYIARFYVETIKDVTPIVPTYTLTVQYLFADGKKPAVGFEDYTETGYYTGEHYEAKAIDAPAGYGRTDSGNTSGTITEDTTVLYLYAPNGSASVTVYYVDAETGEHLLRPQTQTGLIGTEFDVSGLKLSSINAKGKAYDLVNTNENMDGTYQRGGTIIRLLYNVRPEPTYTLNVYYMFADGKKPATGFVDYTETNFHYGDSYEAKAIAAPAGYTRTDSGDTTGTITGNTDVYYLYTPNGNASVTVYYVNAETGVHILAPKSETGLIGADFDVSNLKLDSIEYKGTTYDLVNFDEVMTGTYKVGGTDIRLLYKEHTSGTNPDPDPDPDPDPNPSHSKNYYYRVDYVYTGYDKDGKEIYSDKTEGSVTKTGSSSYTLKNEVDRNHDGHSFGLVSDAKMTGSLSGHTSKNNPYVFTVYYEFTEFDDGKTPGGDKPPVDGGDSTGSVDKPNGGNNPGSGNNADSGKERPNDKVPGADVPKTGDSMTLWVLAAAASGAGLIWLAISGKKRKEAC